MNCKCYLFLKSADLLRPIFQKVTQLSLIRRVDLVHSSASYTTLYGKTAIELSGIIAAISFISDVEPGNILVGPRGSEALIGSGGMNPSLRSALSTPEESAWTAFRTYF